MSRKERQRQEKSREDEEKGEQEELEGRRGCILAHVQKGKTSTREKITRKEKEKKEELEGAKAAWRHMCRQERQGQEKAREYKEREKEN